MLPLSHVEIPFIHKAYLVGFAIFAIFISFIPQVTKAEILFGQLIDNTGIISVPSNGYVVAGSFTTGTEGAEMDENASYDVTVRRTTGFCSSGDFAYLNFSETPDVSNIVYSQNINTGGSMSDDWERVSTNFTNDGTLDPSTTYYVVFSTQCNPGNYDIQINTAEDNTYGYITDSGGEPPSDLTTRIIWVNPPVQNPSATTTSRTIDFEFQYYLNSNTASASEYSHILLQLYPLSYPNDPAQRITVATTTELDSLATVSVTATTERDGYYLGLVSFWNGESEDDLCDWWEVFGCTDVTVIVGPTFKNNFNAATTTISADAPPFITQTFSESCDSLDGGGLIDIDAGLCRTFGYLFIPSQDAYTKLSNDLNQVLANKQPFSYFYVAIEKIEAISESEGEATTNLVLSLGDEGPFGTSITMFNWEEARTGFAGMCDEQCANVIVWIEWIAFLCFVFIRISRPVSDPI